MKTIGFLETKSYLDIVILIFSKIHQLVNINYRYLIFYTKLRQFQILTLNQKVDS